MLITFNDQLTLTHLPKSILQLACDVVQPGAAMGDILAELVKVLTKQHSGLDETISRITSKADQVNAYECLRQILLRDSNGWRFSASGEMALLTRDAEDLTVAERLTVLNLACGCLLNSKLVKQPIDETGADIAEVMKELKQLRDDRKKRVKADGAAA